MLSKDTLVEVQRQDLIGQHVGDTPIKTNAKVCAELLLQGLAYHAHKVAPV